MIEKTTIISKKRMAQQQTKTENFFVKYNDM